MFIKYCSNICYRLKFLVHPVHCKLISDSSLQQELLFVFITWWASASSTMCVRGWIFPPVPGRYLLTPLIFALMKWHGISPQLLEACRFIELSSNCIGKNGRLVLCIDWRKTMMANMNDMNLNPDNKIKMLFLSLQV